MLPWVLLAVEISNAPQTMKAVPPAAGCIPELDGKTLLMGHCVSVSGHENSGWDWFRLFSLPKCFCGDVRQADGESCLWQCWFIMNPAYCTALSIYWEGRASLCNSNTIVMGVTHFFWLTGPLHRRELISGTINQGKDLCLGKVIGPSWELSDIIW